MDHFSGDPESNAVDDDEGVLGIKDEFGGCEVRIKGEDEVDNDLRREPSALIETTSGLRPDILDNVMDESGREVAFQVPQFGEPDDEPERYFQLDMDPEILRGPVLKGADGNGLAMSESILILD